MAEYRKIFLTVNPELASVVDPETPEIAANGINFIPSVYNGETVVFCVSFVNSNGVAVPLSEDDRFELSIDCNFIHDSDPLMAYSKDVNMDSDWNEAELENGKISIRVTCATCAFNDKLNNNEKINSWLEIKKYSGASAEASVMLLNIITAKNVIHLNEGMPEPATVDYYTAAQIDALVSNLGGGSPELRFSVDASDWHSNQNVSDRYWGFRISEAAGWSASIAIPQPATPAGRVEYAFTVELGNRAESIRIYYNELGVENITDLSLFEVQPGGGELNISHTSSLQMVFYTEYLELVWNGIFPNGTYTIRG